MLNRIHEARKNQSGFTLIELLMVIVILGVLAGIVVFAVGGITDTGKASACKADVKNVEIASEAYYAKYGAYAADIDKLLVSATPDKGFLKEKPSTTNGYTITYSSTGAVTATGACTVS
ncbi:prepilin-type N-terminal cleavage/methylation domain-containing protein [Kribbella speibonae]|uniref:Prepilin-type N-terminal cleavage/methylation domain-containing protein n=1 Tax=Kribbella speibonae TaxID=1572660 RepID=A0A4R0JCG0_9ACTN|nr:prepilin-type N-terminal cleavage/methylation domain-containing protein [Kribbella speibonae]TCC42296.1 prepilin-type N-terminal cleavage/methylation domain-containing protein [Kribbella speibonae]